ncbi:proton-associated sugar transporter A-like isoform X2 [Condylostylus longicornis]|uniref:proton-associated sugar transporter A-like isoform X2 n=1 Tax=Condylostylus longicornis TaxID=2530218 RepID=UPI00244E1DAC|nr:proton-associated sugar transporter A-like isoform X2 [Condylostylus longicornis]
MVGVTIGNNESNMSCDPIMKYLYKIREEHARQQEKDYSHVFRKKSRFDLIRLSCIIVGIEFAYAAETAFVSPILLQIGIDHKHMTMVWGLSPLLGFFVAPFLGSISDRCRLAFGRRRPLILILSVGILCGLLLVPHGKELGQVLGDVGINYFSNETESHVNTNLSQFGIAEALTAPQLIDDSSSNYKFAVILTILGTILLDFNADTCQTPSRAYLLDVCIPDDHATALSIFSTMAGIGGSLGYAMCGIDWESTSFGDFFGGNIKTVFTIVTLLFMMCFVITVTSFREIPLPLIEKDSLLKPVSIEAIKKESEKGKNDMIFYIKETMAMELQNLNCTLNGHPTEISFGRYKKVNTDEENADINGNMENKDFGGFDNVEKNIDNDDEENENEEKVSLAKYLKSIVIMPKSMRILCLTNLLTWMSHLCYCLYFTDFVGEAVFGGKPSEDLQSESNLVYEEGVRFGCWGLAIYAISCSIYSMCTETFIRIFSLKKFYIGGMITYTVGMLILAIWPSKPGVLVLSTTAGIVYSTLFTVPYILVAKYHASGCFQVKRGENIQIKQTRGLGTDVAIVSSMLFVAQLTISLSIGTLVSWLDTTAGVLYAASTFSLLSAISAHFVLYLD